VKDQYFGDVNDFRKYGLLRALTRSAGMQLGVCWMLTAPDGRPDGNKRAYLMKPEVYRPYDPELFDWLKSVSGAAPRVAMIEQTTLLGQAHFASGLLTDRKSERDAFFADCATRFGSCDLVFFDPDNGAEVGSVARGKPGSHKYVYWDEVQAAFEAGSSVLLYQHFIREKREPFTCRIAKKLASTTGSRTLFSFRTPPVLFVMASQPRHADEFRKSLDTISRSWPAREIHSAEC
jgi:hypothetical protein